MPSTPSINAVQTRVIEANVFFYAQFSTDGLNWFPLISDKPYLSITSAIYACELFQRSSEMFTSRGEVVWRSKG